MKMNLIEKWMVNRPSTGKSGVKLASRLMEKAGLEPGGGVLDIGCGRGVITGHIAETYGGQVTGLDIDGQEIEAARKPGNLDNLRYIEGDARSLPFEDRSLDVVIALGVLHHICDWYKAAAEIGRVLKVEGVFISAELIYPDWVISIDEKSGFKFGIYSLDTSRLTRQLQDEGFVTLHSSLKKRALWQDWEAVFKKKWEKAWSRY